MAAFATVAVAAVLVELISILGLWAAWRSCVSELHNREARLRQALMERDACRQLLRDVHEVLCTPTPGGGAAAK